MGSRVVRAKLPWENDKFPRENDKLPRENDNFPKENDNFLRENGNLPRENDKLPWEKAILRSENAIFRRVKSSPAQARTTPLSASSSTRAGKNPSPAVTAWPCSARRPASPNSAASESQGQGPCVFQPRVRRTLGSRAERRRRPERVSSAADYRVVPILARRGITRTMDTTPLALARCEYGGRVR